MSCAHLFFHKEQKKLMNKMLATQAISNKNVRNMLWLYIGVFFLFLNIILYLHLIHLLFSFFRPHYQFFCKCCFGLTKKNLVFAVKLFFYHTFFFSFCLKIFWIYFNVKAIDMKTLCIQSWFFLRKIGWLLYLKTRQKNLAGNLVLPPFFVACLSFAVRHFSRSRKVLPPPVHFFSEQSCLSCV